MTGERNLTATLSNVAVANEIPAKIAPFSGLEVSFMSPFLCPPRLVEHLKQVLGEDSRLSL